MRGWIALGISLGIASTAAAGAAADFGARGFYVAAGGSYTQNELVEEQLEDGVSPGIDLDVDDTWGARGVFGYRILPFLAAELEYEHVGRYDVSVSGGDVARLRANVLTVNVKTLLPLWRVQPYLLVGIGGAQWRFDDELGIDLPEDETEFAGRAGAGVDLHLTPRLVLDAGADVVLSSTDSIPLASDVDFLGYTTVGVALQYRFTGP